MLKKFDRKSFANPYANRDLDQLGEELAELQRECVQEKVPVLITIDGWESSGKGKVLNHVVRLLDAKHYRVNRLVEAKAEEKRLFTLPYWSHLPAYGDFGIFNRSLYDQLFQNVKMSAKQLKDCLQMIEETEKLLAGDHMIQVKYFLHLTKEEQKQRMEELADDPAASFLVSKEDLVQQDKYKEAYQHINEILNATNFSFAPWTIVAAKDTELCSKFILSDIIDKLGKQLKQIKEDRAKEAEAKFSFQAKKKLKDFDLSGRVDKKEYEKELLALQEEAGDLAYELYKAKIPTVLAFEGIDAAGKGGSIQRLLRNIDARLYHINPTSAPNDAEKDHHYLWRFYNNIPDPGEIAIFDRSWYGRVMVERIEKFARPGEWMRAYEEMNTMEKQLTDHDSIVLKFLLLISKKEQKKRFKDREKEKPYKITEEDWRNRKKWKDYLIAMEDMVELTDRENAPWILISSEQKKYARLEVLKAFIRAGKKALANKKAVRQGSRTTDL